jgi:ankyrin repeat protein
MKQQLLITIAAVVLVGCGTPQPTEPPTAKAPDILIHKAADDGNIEAIKQHIAAGTDVNSNDEWTPLHAAANKETAELLIAKGADINAKDNISGTPLFWAALEGNEEVAELLIGQGADVNAAGPKGWTALHWAVAMAQKKSVELLIGEGADVNAKDVIYGTPLDNVGRFYDTATKAKEADLANLLRKHGGKTGEELKAEGK